MAWATIKPPSEIRAARSAGARALWAQVIPATGPVRRVPADRRARAHRGLFVSLDQLWRRRNPGLRLVR